MRFHTLIAAAATIAPVLAATELKVDVYEGPTECEDEDTVFEGNYISMHYTSTIYESSDTENKGQQFDSSYEKGETFNFTVGEGFVISGWDEGVRGLCKGAKASIIIPPNMGYGEQNPGSKIPSGATLRFDVEVVDIAEEGPDLSKTGPPNVFNQVDRNGDNRIDKDEIDRYFKDQGEETPEGLFESDDKDGDGFISFDEFSGPKDDFNPVQGTLPAEL